MANFSVDNWNNISGIYRDLRDLSDSVNGKMQEALGGAIVAAQKGLPDVANALNVAAAKLNGLKVDASDISGKVKKYGAQWQQDSGESLGGVFDWFNGGGMDSNQALAQVAQVGPGMVNYYKGVAGEVDTTIAKLTSTPAKPMTIAQANALIKSTKAKQAGMGGGMFGGVGTYLPWLALVAVGGAVLWQMKRGRR